MRATPIASPRSHRRRVLLLLGASCLFVFAGGASTAFAVSGGGYSPYQQGCQPGDSDYATPNGQTYPGCHNTALNIESGGTTQGDANDGNTKYAQVGLDQSPNDPNSQGTPTPYSIGEPGSTGSPHALCASANTDGTGVAPAGPGVGPEAPGPAADAPNGCGDNPTGAGFDSSLDYYEYYCPIAATLGDPCEATSYGTSRLTLDPGQSVAYQPILQDGVLLYYGMDDNSDNGEHDGLGPFSDLAGQNNNGAVNGASDGGSILAVIDPMKATETPSQTNPEGAANASSGACADGICVGATTQQQAVYHGCGATDASGQAPCAEGTPQNANVYDYSPNGSPANDPSVESESPNCNAGDATTSSEASCGPGGMNSIRSHTPANEYTEPGVQLYADPDSQRSPAAPAPLWPTPALYVGTCGVYAGSAATSGQVLGSLPSLPVPLTNKAGQLAVDPNPSAC